MKFFKYLLLFTISSYALAQMGEVKRNGVKVYSQPDESSLVICTLDKKAKVTLSEKTGMFWKTENACTGKSQIAYVKMVDVFRTPISNDKATQAIQNALAKDREALEVTNARQRSSNAVMGVRGLDDGESDLSSAGNITPDLKGVYNMEDRKVNDNDIRKIENGVHKELENH